MNRDAARLVDHEQVIVLIDKRQRPLLARQRNLLRRWLVLDRLAAAQALALPRPATVHEHLPRGEHPHGQRTRAYLGHGCQNAIEPLARQLASDLELGAGHRSNAVGNDRAR